MDETERQPSSGGVAAVVMVMGGVAGMIGAFLTWASVEVSVRGQGGSRSRLGGQGGLGGQGRLGGGQGGLGGGQGGLGGQPGASSSPGLGGTPGSLPRGRFGAGGRSFQVHGLDTTSGRVVLALCIALIVVALFAWLASRFWLQLGAIAMGLVLGLISLVMTITVLVSPESLFGVIGTRLGTAGIPVSIGAGLWLALAGSVVAVIASVVWLAGHRRAWLGPAPVARQPDPPPTTREPSAAEQPTTVLPPAEPGLAPE